MHRINYPASIFLATAIVECRHIFELCLDPTGNDIRRTVENYTTTDIRTRRAAEKSVEVRIEGDLVRVVAS